MNRWISESFDDFQRIFWLWKKPPWSDPDACEAHKKPAQPKAVKPTVKRREAPKEPRVTAAQARRFWADTVDGLLISQGQPLWDGGKTL